MNPQTTTRPALVRFALWRVPTRFAAKAWEAASLAITMALAIANAVFDIGPEVYVYAALFLLASLWYAYAIRWMDQNDGWAPQRRRS